MQHVVGKKPLIKTAGWAAGSFLAIAGLHWFADRGFEVSLRSAAVCVAGALYTNLFEHLWHRYAMHGRRPDARHATHHRLFYGAKFQTSDAAALAEIATAWYIFPVLLAIHYPTFLLLFPAPLAPAFFFGVTAHYVLFEVTHWYTHVANNGFDRVVARIPGVCRLRAGQIRHHRLHHAEPMVNFNFNPPYAGDRIGGVLRR